MGILLEGIGIGIVLAVIIGGCTYNNHLERRDRLEHDKIQLEKLKLEKSNP